MNQEISQRVIHSAYKVIEYSLIKPTLTVTNLKQRKYEFEQVERPLPMRVEKMRQKNKSLKRKLRLGKFISEGEGEKELLLRLFCRFNKVILNSLLTYVRSWLH